MYIILFIFSTISPAMSNNVTYNISNWTPCFNNTKQRILTVCEDQYCIVINDFDSHTLILRENCYTENKILNIFVTHWYLIIIIGIFILCIVQYILKKTCPIYRIYPEI